MCAAPIEHHARMWEVVAAEPRDVASWLEVVREVEPLFGPMPGFEAALTRKIGNGTAVCARDAAGQVLGGALLRVVPHAEIAWLAVRTSARGQGVGHALVADLLRRFAGAAEVTVDAFGADSAAGRPARRLYESFGFAAAELLDRGPEGGTRQRFRLQPLPSA